MLSCSVLASLAKHFRGATPGVLRGSGATYFYQQTEHVPLLAWRGRWARQKTLEYYLQEVAAQMLLGRAPSGF